MYNVIWRRIYESILAMEKQNVLHMLVCVCVCVRACGVRGRQCVQLRLVGVGAQALPCVRSRVALPIQHATGRHVTICGLSGSTIFFDIIS